MILKIRKQFDRKLVIGIFFEESTADNLFMKRDISPNKKLYQFYLYIEII